MSEKPAGKPGKASIILPIHNQGDHIEAVVEGHVEALKRVPSAYEMLLVTNGCTDDSVAVCRTLADRHPELRVLDLERGGWGRAVAAGLAAAEGEILCYTNSARTTPEMLTLMLVYAIAYPGAVLKANRRIRDRWTRRLGSLIYNLECRSLFDLSMWDINGTPKVFPRMFDRLLRLRQRDDLIDLEFNAVCRRQGYPMIEVPLLATVRHGGRSTTGYVAALRMYWGAYQLRKKLDRESDGPAAGN